MLEQETPNIASMASLPTLSAPGLLVMDVDSTLIDEEVIDELGVAAGVGEQIASVTARAMNGELDFREALRARVALLKGLPTTIFDEVYHRVHFTHGALELIDTLHAHDWKVGVVSGGFHEVVDRLAADAHLDYWIANRLEAADGRLTGHVLGDIVTFSVNLNCLSCCFFVNSRIFLKLLQKGRSHKNAQLLKIWFWFSNFLQSILYGFGDSLPGIGESSVQIK